MNKRFTKIIYLMLAIVMSLSLAGCGSKSVSSSTETAGKQSVPAVATEKKNLKIGCLAYSEPIIQWIKEGLAPLGYNVEVVMFDANQLPATALKDGSLDGIVANHRPWILTFNKENNCNLQMVEPYYFYGLFGIYSAKYKTVAEFPQNSQIAVPGDPTNMDKSLRILKEAGLITLNEKTGAFYTVLDIKDNPKNIKLVETEITQTARSIKDVDAIVSSAFYVSKEGSIDPKAYLFQDPQNKNFPLGLIVKNEDLKAKWAVEAIKLLRSDKYRAKFEAEYQGKYVLFE